MDLNNSSVCEKGKGKTDKMQKYTYLYTVLCPCLFLLNFLSAGFWVILGTVSSIPILGSLVVVLGETGRGGGQGQQSVHCCCKEWF